MNQRRTNNPRVLSGRMALSALAMMLMFAVCGCSEAKPKRKRGGSGGEAPQAPIAAAPVKAGTAMRASEKASLAAFANYKPPCPNREDPFAPPDMGKFKDIVKQANVEPGVSFKGIVDVDGPKAILSINGRVYFVGEGESKMDVQVVKLEQNQVILRRNGKEWSPNALHEDADRVLTSVISGPETQEPSREQSPADANSPPVEASSSEEAPS